jgi:hypothetical protein
MDHLSWEMLAQKVKTRRLNGTAERYFSPVHIHQAALAAAHAFQVAQAEAENGSALQSPGEEAARIRLDTEATALTDRPVQ